MRSTMTIRFSLLFVLVALGSLEVQAQQTVWWRFNPPPPDSVSEGTTIKLPLRRSNANGTDTVHISMSGAVSRIVSFEPTVIILPGFQNDSCQVVVKDSTLCDGDQTVTFRIDSTSADSIDEGHREIVLTILDNDGGVDPGPIIADPDTVCHGSAIDLQAAALAPGWVGSWTKQPSGFNGAFDDPDEPNTTFTPQAPGSVTLLWIITNNGCTDTSEVDITVVAQEQAAAGSNDTICSGGTTAALGSGPPSGWSGLWSASAGGGSFSDDNSGNSTYTYGGPTSPVTLTWVIQDGLGVCANDTATVQVIVNPLPNAGTDGTAFVCSNGDAFDLLDSLGNTPLSGGVWNTGSGNYDPATMDPGAYTYTVTDGNTSCFASATVTVTEIPAPNAGTDSIVHVCAQGTSVDLFPFLGGADPDGSWIGPDQQLHSGVFDPAVDTSGIYTYTVQGISPCNEGSAMVTVFEDTTPNTGIDTDTTVCSNDASFNLFSLLGGNPDTDGSWTDPNGDPHSGIFTPSIGQSGTYVYRIDVPLPCLSDSTEVIVNVIQATNAGISADTTVCHNTALFDLFFLLSNADTNGSWTGPSTLGGGHLGTFTPGSSEAGQYTYTVPGDPPCMLDTSTVEVAVVDSVLIPDVVSLDGTTFCLGQYTTIIVDSAQAGAEYVWNCEGCTVNFTTGDTVELLWDSVPGNWSFSVFAQIDGCTSDTVEQAITLGTGTPSCPRGIVFFEPHGLAILDPLADQFQWGSIDNDGEFDPKVGATNQTIFDPENITDCLPYYAVRTRQGNGCWTTTTTCVDNTPPHDCATSGMAPEGDDLEVSVSPNPPQDNRIHVLLSGVIMDEPLAIELITANGKVLHSQTYIARPQLTIAMNPAALSPGLYLLRVQGSSDTRTSKVTIE